ncbi:hypothetical protein Tco_0205928 [Tanacetum coccineum]
MYLTASRPDIMFAVCLCARFQVTPKVSHLHAVKRIFRYLKHQPNLGLWYPKDSPFHLEAFSDSDYAGDNHDRRSTSGGCQYLGRRLVSWQCKKQTIVAISSTEAEYVAAASCCAQVLWMQNQLLDYGFNFMNTEIHIDNESTICIVRNPVLHSKTKHIQIRHHFIRDCYEQRLINVVKVHTDDNVADLLTKGFDLARFNFLEPEEQFKVDEVLARPRGLSIPGPIQPQSQQPSQATDPKDKGKGILSSLDASINYSLLVDPDLIGPWLQQFWATASLRVINEVPHIRAMVAGKRILISEETIRADLLFDDADGVDCPQLKYLVHVLTFTVLSPKSTSWEQFGTNIASALVGLATNQKFNFSLMIMNGMLGHIANGKPFLMVLLQLKVLLIFHDLPMIILPQMLPQTSGGDEGLLDLYALNREVRRLKKQTISQAKQIHKLKVKLKKLSKGVEPVVKHHAFWVQSQNLKKRRKKQRKKQRKKVSSVKLGRNKDESNLSEENNDQDDHTAFVYEDFDATAFVTPDLERTQKETEERKSDETEEVIIEEKDTSDVKSGDTEELDLEKIQSTARQSTVTPRTLNFDDEAGPSSPIRPTQEEEPEEQFKDDELLADILLNRTRGLSIPGPMQSQPQQPTQATDPKEKGKGILVEEPKKKKLTLQQIRALETKMMRWSRKIQAECDAEEGEKGYKNLQKLKYPQMKELYDKVQESIKESFKDFIPMGSEKEKQMLQERDAKRLLRKRKATITEEQPSKKLKLRTETIDELRNYLRIVDFEQSKHLSEAFDTLWEILAHVLIGQDLHHSNLVVQDYYKHIPPTGLGLILLGVHTLELEEGTDDSNADRKNDIPLSRKLMNMMLDHVHHGLLPFLVSKDQTKSLCSMQAVSTQTDCIQDTAQKMKLKRLKASIATMTRQTDAEQGRPTIKKLEVKQVEFKLGEDCWEIQV